MNRMPDQEKNLEKKLLACTLLGSICLCFIDFDASMRIINVINEC